MFERLRAAPPARISARELAGVAARLAACVSCRLKESRSRRPNPAVSVSGAVTRTALCPPPLLARDVLPVRPALRPPLVLLVLFVVVVLLPELPEKPPLVRVLFCLAAFCFSCAVTRFAFAAGLLLAASAACAAACACCCAFFFLFSSGSQRLIAISRPPHKKSGGGVARRLSVKAVSRNNGSGA